MQSITFSSPTLASAQMNRQDQIDVGVNQAAAAIVCCYLDHMNAAIAKGISGATTTAQSGFITQPELVSLINDVQAALRLVP